nr:DNA-protecting protein DprA [Cytophagales bacterium]
MNDKLLYEVALGLLSGIGNMLTKQLVSYCGSAEAVFKTPKGKLLKIPGIGEHLAKVILNQNVLKLAEKEINFARKYDIELIFYTHQRYPKRLKQIIDAPELIYFKGNTNLDNTKVVSIIGTRQATEYGKRIVNELIEEFTQFNALIVSGLAYGIDITAHRRALYHHLPTVGVMASGIDIIYPAVHRNTVVKMLENGGILTEYPFGKKPDAPHFPTRNRIIAGLADCIIVIEAGKRGGALITAEIANSYNRDVFAVPGNIGEKFSEGCNNLIKSHRANLLTSIEDIKYVMNWVTKQEKLSSGPGNNRDKGTNNLSYSFDISKLTTDEVKIYELLKEAGEMMIDDLSIKTQLPISKTASLLLNLEFQGIVKVLPGKKFSIN